MLCRFGRSRPRIGERKYTLTMAEDRELAELSRAPSGKAVRLRRVRELEYERAHVRGFVVHRRDPQLLREVGVGDLQPAASV